MFLLTIIFMCLLIDTEDCDEHSEKWHLLKLAFCVMFGILFIILIVVVIVLIRKLRANNRALL